MIDTAAQSESRFESLVAARDDAAMRLRLLRAIWRELQPHVPRGASRNYFTFAAMAVTGLFLMRAWVHVQRRS